MEQIPGDSAKPDQAIVRDQELMKRLKIGVAASSSFSESDEQALSEGEFTSHDEFLRYFEKEKGKGIIKESKRRQKKARKEEKRFGGPIQLWTEKERLKELQAQRLAKVLKQHFKNKRSATMTTEETTKKDEKETTKKAATKKTTTKKGKGWSKAKGNKKTKAKRGPRVVDGKITLLQKENPKRKGSSAYKRYELYKKHKTVASYLDAGGRRSSLRYDERHNFIKLSGLKTKADMK